MKTHDAYDSAWYAGELDKAIATIADLTEENAALREKLSQQWTPVEDGEYDGEYPYTIIGVDGRRLTIENTESMAWAAADLSDDLRLCWRKPGKE